MGYFLDDNEWEDYEGIINEFHKDAFQQTLIWQRVFMPLNIDGTDGDPRKLPDVILKGLIQYNHFRSWPMSKETIPGQIDNESMLVFLNKEYLREEGHLNADGNLNYDPGSDRFIVDGIVYVDKGQSATAQTKDKTLLQFLILKREETSTANPIY